MKLKFYTPDFIGVRHERVCSACRRDVNGVNMQPKSVLVSYILNSTKNPFSSSGTMISKDWVLAHGTLLEPLVSHSDELRSVTDDLGVGILTKNESEKSLVFSVSWEVKATDFNDPPCCGAKVFPNVNKSSKEDSCQRSETFMTKKARLVAAWKCPLLVEAFEGILSSWRFSESPRDDKVAVADKDLFPLFLLLKIEENGVTKSSNLAEPLEVLKNFAKSLVTSQRGQQIEIESTPFGNPVFMNSVANGVVSNVLGPAKSILLTDANAVIGCEGGPIFVSYKSGQRAVCGMVLAPLSWCRGEWVGYTLGVSLLPCLHRILNTLDENNNFHTPPASDPDIVELIDKSVVVVRCGAGWGSGVLVDKKTGTFLTCSHVVREAPNSRITIRNCNFSARGELVYKTATDKSYDLAIVRVDPQELSSMENVSMRTAIIRKRFPLISSREQPLILPTITRGRVSRVSAGMLQTSCCIQSGISGGPVIAYPTGALLGIVVCNATSAGSKALFPRVNMAVPVTVFRDPITEYLRTQDTSKPLSSNEVTSCIYSPNETGVEIMKSHHAAKPAAYLPRKAGLRLLVFNFLMNYNTCRVND
ncbi:peroxisomal leader peptide-processing protease isoform X3 [Athalia rosae]|uniref:peroxisomal leader peptide-processing protease isoform X3 n=1 Tax=Athalia rosae TaxID=37344 RepID=UPI002033FEA8|nr:peroxisomal leader peptide-processing protease isoform X3 [Athalia rosae]